MDVTFTQEQVEEYCRRAFFQGYDSGLSAGHPMSGRSSAWSAWKEVKGSDPTWIGYESVADPVE